MNPSPTEALSPVSELLLKWEEARLHGHDLSIEDLCRAHPDVRGEVEERIRILRQFDRENAPPLSAPDDRPPSVPGYELLDLLGTGGMGQVWRARHTKLQRIVAVKLILSGARARPSERLRFRIEAEALAQLHHSNIVQLYEIGEADGCPYLVLEFVDGPTLAQQLRDQPLSHRHSAEVITAIARAMDLAHRRGIIHRDLKPGNILLSAIDQQPSGSDLSGRKPKAESRKPVADCRQPKVTDFGLAKRLAERDGATRTGDIFGTPSYMAPEQATGSEVGPATDIYALGAVLYELLTGRPPFQAATPVATLLQVTDQEPSRPSLLRAVPRDLETISLKCLEKSPARRYATAGDLADDLERYIRNEPIRARAVGPAERAFKWMRRHPALSAMGAALASVILGSIVSLSLLYAKAVSEKHAADQARMQAEQSDAISQAVNDFFLNHVTAAAQPQGYGAGKDVTLFEALQTAEPKIHDAFAAQPVTEAAVRHALGRTYLSLGKYKLAEPQLESAFKLFREHGGLDAAATAACAATLGQLWNYDGRYAQALALLESAIPPSRLVGALPTAAPSPPA